MKHGLRCFCFPHTSVIDKSNNPFHEILQLNRKTATNALAGFPAGAFIASQKGADIGYVYLIHFRPRYKQAGHYLGYADDVWARFAEHLHGKGARLTQVAVENGIALELTRVWKGDRKLERRLKRHKHSPLLCPRCNPQAHRRAAAEMGLEQVDLEIENCSYASGRSSVKPDAIVSMQQEEMLAPPL